MLSCSATVGWNSFWRLSSSAKSWRPSPRRLYSDISNPPFGQAFSWRCTLGVPFTPYVWCAGSSRESELICKFHVFFMRRLFFFIFFTRLRWWLHYNNSYVLMLLSPNDDRYFLNGVIAGFTVLIEAPGRQVELGLYCLPRALDTAWHLMLKRGLVRNIPNAEMALFCASMGLMMTIYQNDPSVINNNYLSVLTRVFGRN